MIGTSLCRWAISYFAVAIVWLLLAEVLVVAGFGFPNHDIGGPDTLVIVHMVSIGWLSTVLCGALFQFVPVLVAMPLYAERWTLPALALLTLGLTILLAGFLTLGGHFTGPPGLLPVGASLLIAGFALVVANLGMTLWSARPLPGPARFVAAGLACICVTAAFGGMFSLVLSGTAVGAQWPDLLVSGVPIHAIAGLGGWLTFTAMGVSYRLLAMFMLAPDGDARLGRLAWLAGVAALAVGAVGGVLALWRATGVNLALLLAGVAALLSLIAYGRDMLGLYRARKRRALELNTRMSLVALASLVAVAILGAAFVATGSLPSHVGALAFLGAFGWLTGLVLANLYKIVPFLTWLETYGPVMGRVPTPRVQDLVDERRALKWFVLFFAGSWAATLMLLVDAALGFRIAVAAVTLATLGLGEEFIRARRLADVAEPLRLPTGAVVPQLLVSRN
ncbi:hypothetical protein GGD66_001881 [Bradyrhizobium sp. CIR48]|uniref:hypothetical protein n=1 Tax=Bradyrhizobium sp. CIR48 TaxID=2663840 RepID=UPI001605A3E9|nr:hypothetical protein [Bradyrhizobium sp. CIR48]MBB4423341.1 hypothetical protein [Bradyrhizobium sp. CIR48]